MTGKRQRRAQGGTTRVDPEAFLPTRWQAVPFGPWAQIIRKGISTLP